jgi:murein DD-endopeptidase MepM/ murein hydrolase activator NlpD
MAVQCQQDYVDRILKWLLNLPWLPKDAYSVFRVSQCYEKGTHDGIDLAAPEGTPIYAITDGIVQYAKNASGDSNCAQYHACNGGNVINLAQIGSGAHTFTVQYAHLQKFAEGINPGKYVKRGELIGYVGHTGHSTGNHLHLAVQRRDTNEWVDPAEMLGVIGALPGTGADIADAAGAIGDIGAQIGYVVEFVFSLQFLALVASGVLVYMSLRSLQSAEA